MLSAGICLKARPSSLARSVGKLPGMGPVQMSGEIIRHPPPVVVDPPGPGTLDNRPTPDLGEAVHERPSKG